MHGVTLARLHQEAAMTQTDRDGVLSRAWLKRQTSRLGLNVIAFLVITACLGFVAALARNGLMWLVMNAGAGVALFVGVLFAAATVIVLPGIGREDFKGTHGVLTGALMGFAAGGAVLLAYTFAGLSAAMSSLGWVTYVTNKPPADMLIDLSETYMWHVYDLIPSLEINRALGQDMPRIVLESVVVNGAPDQKGLLLLTFRIVVALVLFRTVVRLFTPPEKEANAARATSEE